MVPRIVHLLRRWVLVSACAGGALCLTSAMRRQQLLPAFAAASAALGRGRDRTAPVLGQSNNVDREFVAVGLSQQTKSNLPRVMLWRSMTMSPCWQGPRLRDPTGSPLRSWWEPLPKVIQSVELPVGHRRFAPRAGEAKSGSDRRLLLRQCPSARPGVNAAPWSTVALEAFIAPSRDSALPPRNAARNCSAAAKKAILFSGRAKPWPSSGNRI